MVRALTLVLVVLGLVAPAASDAFVVQEKPGPQSGSNGIALGPDGNFWVAEEFTGSVVRMSPDGTVVTRYPVGDAPAAVVNGPGDRVWVAVSGTDKKLVWFDAKSPTPTAHDVTVTGGCGPVALAASGDRLFYSLPCDGKLGYVEADGSGGATVTGFGTVFDLAFTSGKLFAPDFDGDVVRRANTALSVESTIGTPTGGQPDGVTGGPGGTVWVTEFATGKLARFPADQNNGNAVEVTLTGGTLTDPYGITTGPDGRIYVAGKGSSNLARVDADGTKPTFFALPDAQPFRVVQGPDGDLWMTDQKQSRLLRFVSSAPRVATGAAAASGAVTATVDPRGNDTTVVFDYGTTTAYGASTAPQTVPGGVAPVPVNGTIPGLAAGTTYHVRARATNAEGETSGADATFTTAAAPPAPPAPTKVAAKAAVKVKVSKRGTVIRSLVITGATGTETATLSCKGKRCPFTKKAYKLKAGKRTFGKSLFKGRRLKKGVVVTIRITAPGQTAATTKVTIRKGRKPAVKRT